MIDKFEGRYRIESARMRKWNYGWNASYFVTICTEEKEPFFGDIDNKQFAANSMGNIALECWEEMPYRYPFVQLEEFVVMPNHVHGIVRIKHETIGMEAEICKVARSSRDAINRVSTSTPDTSTTTHDESTIAPDAFMKTNHESTSCEIISLPQKQLGGITGNHNPMLHENLSRVIRWYKGRITYECRKINPSFGWQQRYHEHIIRNEKSYRTIKAYIINNPSNWEDDKFYNIDTL